MSSRFAILPMSSSLLMIFLVSFQLDDATTLDRRSGEGEGIDCMVRPNRRIANPLSLALASCSANSLPRKFNPLQQPTHRSIISNNRNNSFLLFFLTYSSTFSVFILSCRW